MVVKGICGIMFFSNSSWNSGGGGNSNAKNKNGDLVFVMARFES
jgi:hypothetical protein